MSEQNTVIIVDENDNELWTYPKLAAHEESKLHRAFSIFVFNSENELLLQQRAKEKYHSGGLWTNTVCSHPRPNEDINNEAKLRLIDEMWFTTDVEHLFWFLYKSDYENGLCEHEYDHVFIWYYDKNPNPRPDEVMDYKWITLDDLKLDMDINPEIYTSWFKIILGNIDFVNKIKEKLK